MKILKLLFGFIISIICLYFAIRKVDIHEVFRILSCANCIWIFVAFLLGIIKTGLMGCRWRYCMPLSNRISIVSSFYFYSIGNIGSMLLPFRAGDFIRAFMVANELKVSNSKILGTIASEHVIDLFVLGSLLLIVFGLYSYHWPSYILPTLLIFFICIIFLLAGLFFLKKHHNALNRLKKAIFQHLPKWVTHLGKMISGFYSGFFQLGNVSNILKILSSTICIWVVQCFWIYILLCSLGIEESYNLGFHSVLVLVIMMVLAVMVPSSPSYIGTLHLMIVLGLSQMGVPDSVALSYAILVHAHGTIVAIVLGLYSLWKQGFNLQFLRKKYEMKQAAI